MLTDLVLGTQSITQIITSKSSAAVAQNLLIIQEATKITAQIIKKSRWLAR